MLILLSYKLPLPFIQRLFELDLAHKREKKKNETEEF